MNCPNCGLSLDANFTGPCPRCGQQITGNPAANAGGYGLGMDAFSHAPTIRSSGPGSSGPNENYGLPYPSQSDPSSNYGSGYPSQSGSSGGYGSNYPSQGGSSGSYGSNYPSQGGMLSAPSGWPNPPSSAPNSWQDPPPGVSSGWPGQPPGPSSGWQSTPPPGPGGWPGQSSGYNPSGYPGPYQPGGGFTPQPPMPPRKSRTGLIIGSLAVVVVLLVGGLGIVLLTSNGHNQPGTTGVGATATTALTPSPTPTPTPLFQDPLTSNANGWSDDSNCFFQGNAYHIKNGFICYAPADSVGDAAISVDVKQLSGPLLNPYGLVFRRTSTGNYYEFDIDGNGKWAFFRTVNNTGTRLVDYTANAAIKKGLNATNTLMVQAKGSHFTFFVNGTQVGNSDDPTFPSGISGLEAYDSIEVAFNNFLITSL